MKASPSILIVGVPHVNARGAETDALDMALYFIRHNWTVRLILGAEATIDNVMYQKADACWFTGECTAETRLQLEDGVLHPRLLTMGKELTIFDCCHVGMLIKPDGKSPVVCAASSRNWNESDGSSIWMHAVRHLIADANPDTPILHPTAPYMPIETFRAIGSYMCHWCDVNSPTIRQAPVMGAI